MNKKTLYQSPATAVVEVSTETMVCASSTSTIIIATDILNSGSGNPLEDMEYHEINTESF